MNDEPVTILHVEDDPAHALFVKRIFENFRIANRLIHVSDGQAALDYLYRKENFQDEATAPRPGIILLDLRLPKIDGLDVLKTIKTDPALASIPVVVLSTSKSEEDMIKAYKYQANSYLVKPFDFNHLVTMIESFGYYWLVWNKVPSP